MTRVNRSFVASIAISDGTTGSVDYPIPRGARIENAYASLTDSTRAGLPAGPFLLTVVSLIPSTGGSESSLTLPLLAPPVWLTRVRGAHGTWSLKTPLQTQDDYAYVIRFGGSNESGATIVLECSGSYSVEE